MLAVAEHAGDVAEGTAVGDLDPGELGPAGFGVVEQPQGDRVAGGFRDCGHGLSLCRAGPWGPLWSPARGAGYIQVMIPEAPCRGTVRCRSC